jgi:hypothetical protein
LYAADAPAATLEGWGEPLVTQPHLKAPTNVLDLGGHRGRSVLIGILDRGDAAGRAPAEISEVRVTAR